MTNLIVISLLVSLFSPVLGILVFIFGLMLLGIAALLALLDESTANVLFVLLIITTLGFFWLLLADEEDC